MHSQGYCEAREARCLKEASRAWHQAKASETEEEWHFWKCREQDWDDLARRWGALAEDLRS